MARLFGYFAGNSELFWISYPLNQRQYFIAFCIHMVDIYLQLSQS